MPAYEWYQELIKPMWAPPSSLFGPVWTVLYALIAVSFGAVFIEVAQKRLPARLALPFALNLVFNFAFTPIQFGLQNNLLAAADVLLVLGTLIWALVAIYPHRKWIAYINAPYLAWAAFATCLQLTVTYLNF
ncbi:tryptophan-rich sensory protein [Candidatus Kaiserbacteria bacterium]|nr:tryptophan-rich sensory protein [Candidatus Kaiserbacteria bacterium]